MIKVGFIGTTSREWMGGLNYLKNLLFALNQLDKKEIEIYVFVGKKTDLEIKKYFSQYATLVESSIFDKGSIMWFLSKIEQRVFSTNFLIQNLLKKYKLEILSHSFLTNIKNIKIINWIPDFQHIHLRDMFSKKELNQRNKSFMDMIEKSDAIVLSSQDAYGDFKRFAPGYEYKVKVLRFVSQPPNNYIGSNDYIKNMLLRKYKLNDDFFYMPNQFWKHKNHFIVFRAIDQLVKSGINISLVCTGYLHDYRNKRYIKDIYKFIKSNNLNQNIKILGLVSSDDVFGLINISKAVINPSLFEGWSSTVEECKSVGKNMILSNISVHREQYPNALFFPKDSVDGLKKILINYKNNNHPSNFESLEIRTIKYANAYFDIIRDTVNS